MNLCNTLLPHRRCYREHYTQVFTISAAEPWTVDDLLDEDSQSDRVPLQKLQLLGTVFVCLTHHTAI